jgi:hypothetical protein
VSDLMGVAVAAEVLELEQLAAKVLGLCTTPDGRLLGFHDSWRIQSPTKPVTPDHESLLPSFGLFAARRSRWGVYLDCGTRTPKFPLGHLHGSNLGTEIWLDTTPIVIDPGVTTYSAGVRRSQERSDMAHNGPRATGSRQLYTRGSFRTGRPAAGEVTDLEVGQSDVVLTATTESRVGPATQRTLRLAPDGVTITDRCHGGATMVLHPGGPELERISPTCWRVGPARLDFEKWQVSAETSALGLVLRAQTSHPVAQMVVTSFK